MIQQQSQVCIVVVVAVVAQRERCSFALLHPLEISKGRMFSRHWFARVAMFRPRSLTRTLHHRGRIPRNEPVRNVHGSLLLTKRYSFKEITPHLKIFKHSSSEHWRRYPLYRENGRFKMCPGGQKFSTTWLGFFNFPWM